MLSYIFLRSQRQYALLGFVIRTAFYMESWSLVGKGTSHSEGRRRSVEVGTRLGAGVAAEGVVAELVSKLRSLVDRRHSRRG